MTAIILLEYKKKLKKLKESEKDKKTILDNQKKAAINKRSN